MIWLCSVEDGLEGQSRREGEQLRAMSWSRWKTVELNHQGYGGRNEESRGETWQIFRRLNWLDTCWLDLGLKGEAGVWDASQFSSEWLNGWYCHPPTPTPKKQKGGGGQILWGGYEFGYWRVLQMLNCGVILLVIPAFFCCKISLRLSVLLRRTKVTLEFSKYSVINTVQYLGQKDLRFHHQWGAVFIIVF